MLWPKLYLIKSEVAVTFLFRFWPTILGQTIRIGTV